MHHGHVFVPVCTISILWDFHTNPKRCLIKIKGQFLRESSSQNLKRYSAVSRVVSRVATTVHQVKRGARPCCT
jgi:hypothetical protein